MARGRPGHPAGHLRLCYPAGPSAGARCLGVGPGILPGPGGRLGDRAVPADRGCAQPTGPGDRTAAVAARAVAPRLRPRPRPHGPREPPAVVAGNRAGHAGRGALVSRLARAGVAQADRAAGHRPGARRRVLPVRPRVRVLVRGAAGRARPGPAAAPGDRSLGRGHRERARRARRRTRPAAGLRVRGGQLGRLLRRRGQRCSGRRGRTAVLRDVGIRRRPRRPPGAGRGGRRGPRGHAAPEHAGNRCLVEEPERDECPGLGAGFRRHAAGRPGCTRRAPSRPTCGSSRTCRALARRGRLRKRAAARCSG